LDEALLELGIFYHLFLGEAFDGVEGGGGRGFGSQQDVSESTLPYFAHTVKLIGVENIPRLQFLAALQHYLILESIR
jgi:hypothetical protein